MASTIKIKRSETSGNPASLGAGELAYSGLTDNGSNGGDRLYIGMGTETAGNAVNHVVIGGKYFTDKLDHNPGTLTASSAIIVDADKKIDQLLIDNLDINGNAIAATNTDGSITLTPLGTGTVDVSSKRITSLADPTGAQDAVTLSYLQSYTNTEAIEDSVAAMFTNGTHSGIAVTYNDNAAANGTIDLNVDDFTITLDGDVSGSATVTDLGNTTITVTIGANSVELGTDTTGNYVATIADAGNSNISVANSGAETAAVTLDLTTTTVTAGSYGSATEIPTFTVDSYGRLTAAGTANVATTLSFAGDTGTDTLSLITDTLTVEGANGLNVAVTDNTITVGITDGGIANASLTNSSVTFGTTTVALGATSTSIAGLTELSVDNININGNEITSTDANGDISLNPNGTGNIAVNGARITGLAAPVNGTDATNKTYVDNAVSGLNWKESVNLLADSNVALTGTTGTLVIDSHAALDQTDDGLYRVLLIGQTTDSENGIYIYNDDGANYTLSRPEDSDAYSELIGSSVYVLEGTVYGTTGWVQSNHYLTDFTGQSWVQFSGAGTYTAGDGLTLSGTVFSVNTANGVEISSGNVQLASTVAGDGLTFLSGVVSVGGTADRITVAADSIDIASTYVGQTSLTTLGTITTGVWNADVVAETYGGTGQSSYVTGDILYASGANTLSTLAAGAEGKVLQINASGVPVWADLDGGTY